MADYPVGEIYELVDDAGAAPGTIASNATWTSKAYPIFGHMDPGTKRVPGGNFTLDTTHTGGALTAGITTTLEMPLSTATFATAEGQVAPFTAKVAGKVVAPFSTPFVAGFRVTLTHVSGAVTVVTKGRVGVC